MVAAAIPETKNRLASGGHALGAGSGGGFSGLPPSRDPVAIRRAGDRLEAEFLRRLHRFHNERGGQADGGLSTVAWLRHRCGMTAKAAAYRKHLARTLGEMPATLHSARAGRSSLGNMAMIAHLAGDVGVEQVAPMEPILVQAAETLDPARMRTLTQAARLRLDPDGVLAGENHAHERRWFDCEQSYGGDWFVQGQLDNEAGALVKAVIDAISHGLTPGETRPAARP